VKDGRRIRSFEIPQNVVLGTIVHSAEKDDAQVVRYGSFSSAPTVIDLESYDPETKTIVVSQVAGADARGNTPCAPVLPYRAPVFTDFHQPQLLLKTAFHQKPKY
jgi:hypothetical protein